MQSLEPLSSARQVSARLLATAKDGATDGPTTPTTAREPDARRVKPPPDSGVGRLPHRFRPSCALRADRTRGDAGKREPHSESTTLPQRPTLSCRDRIWETAGVDGTVENTSTALGAWSIVRIAAGAAAITAIVSQLAHVVDDGNPVANFLSYFTIQSNAFAAGMLIVTGLFALVRGHDARGLAHLRGAATLYLAITGIVYALLLRDVDVQTSEPWINTVLHYIMPVVMVIDWCTFPPRRVLPMRRAMLWLAYPAAYVAYSLVRGAAVDWYPYPFLDPREHGFAAVLAVSAAMLVAGAMIIAALTAIGNRRRSTASSG